MVCSCFCTNWPSMGCTQRMEQVPVTADLLIPQCQKDDTHINSLTSLLHVNCSATTNWDPMKYEQHGHVVCNMVMICRCCCRHFVSSICNFGLVDDCFHIYEVMSTCRCPAVINGGYGDDPKLFSPSKLWSQLNGNILIWVPCYDTKFSWNTCPPSFKSTTGSSFNYNGYVMWFLHVNPFHMGLLNRLMNSRKDMKWYHELIHACDPSCMFVNPFCTVRTLSKFFIRSYPNKFVGILLFAWCKHLTAHIFLWLGQQVFSWC